MKKKAYRCDCCSCRIRHHKVRWVEGKPYCSSCHRAYKKLRSMSREYEL